MLDAIIVGSGPAGTAAALQLAGRRVLMLDVGMEPAATTGGGDFHATRGDPDAAFATLIGANFESLANLTAPQPLSLKLKAPGMRFVIERAQELTPVSTANFAGMISLARGGLANGWGAGVYRFTDADLAGYPFGARELAPYYDRLTQEIGISGANDDLAPWFGQDARLQDPLAATGLAADLLARYGERRAELNAQGLFLGRPRLAVLTREHQGRRPYRHEQMEFFRPRDPSIYTPAYTLDRLQREGLVDYRAGWLVTRFREDADGVEVTALNVHAGGSATFRARRLLLAAGGLNTARIVLASAADTRTPLPILDNPLSAFPLCRFDRLGLARDPHDTSLGQLNLIFQEPGAQPLQATLYGINGALRSDAIFDLPLPVGAAAALFRHASAAALLVLTFHPGRPQPNNHVRLLPDGALDVNYEPDTAIGPPEARIIRLLGTLGYRSHPRLVRATPMGSSLHYAGILPMRAAPGPYECDAAGLLSGTQCVHVVDGACLTALPAKNLTLTIMANAMRIAAQLPENAP